MALLIDGYNLLHATGIFGKGTGPGGFQRSREALLRFLAASLDERDRKQATIIFDANDVPPGLPETTMQADMTVRYARDYPDADSLIEELISSHDAPRNLLVVSSDHRIQRAARRRRAAFVDSERWYSELWQQRVKQRTSQKRRIPEKPMRELTADEIDYWVQEFETCEPSDDTSEGMFGKPPPPKSTLSEPDNPFPPGYGEDLL